MLGKILKTLLGLGSASAAAAGGLYLNNKLKEREERLSFLRLADDNAKKIEEEMKKDEATNSYYLPKSNDSDEYWEWLWLYELNALMPVNGRTFTENELKEKEKEVWSHIKNGTYMSAVPGNKKEEIEGGNPEYWKKYKETCLTWSSIDTSKRDINEYFVCLSSFEAEYFMKDTPYKKYKELKVAMPNLTLRKFFWTMWFKFLKEGKSGNSNWGEQFDTWKKKDENKHLFSEAN